MNFFERNALFKNKIEEKKQKLVKERSKELLKECTFESSKRDKKLNINPIEISNRLYYNASSKKTTNTDINKKTNKKEYINTNNNSNTNIKTSEFSINSKIFYKPKIKLNNIKYLNNKNHIL